MEIPDHLGARRERNGHRGHAASRRPSGSGGRHLPRRPGRDRARIGPGAGSDRRAGARGRSSRRAKRAPSSRRAKRQREGEGGGAEPTAEGGRRAAKTSRPKRPRCVSSVGASAPRRSTCSSRVSGTPAGLCADPPQHWLPRCRRARAPARRCLPLEVQRPAGRGPARGAACRDPEARDLHECLGQVGRSRAAVLPSTRRICWSSTTTSTSCPVACKRGSAGAGGPQRAAVDRSALGSQDFLRLRVGVGRPGKGDPRPVADYVLSEFEPELDVDALVARAADAVEVLARDGLEETQARYN